MQRLAKPWYRSRALRVFRDESALTANPHLWSSIQDAMDEASWFVLLASPDAAASEWVNRELIHWLATKSPDHILVVLTDGALAWRAADGALVGSAVPDPLRDAFTHEPRHVDLRWAHTETDLDMHNARFRDAAAQLAAPMHGLAKDDLDSEDVRQHRRGRRLARGGVAVLTLLVVIAVVASVVAVVQRNDADTERDRANQRAIEATAARFAALATSESSSANDEALLLGVEGYERDPSPNTRAALLGALTTAPQQVGYVPGAHDTVTSAISPDGKLVVTGASDGSLRFWQPDAVRPDADTVQPIAALSKDRIVAIAFDHEGKRLYVLHDSGKVETFDPATRARIGTPVQVGKPGALSMAASPDGRTIAVTGLGSAEVFDLGQRVRLYDTRSRRSLGSLPATYDVAFSPNGRLYSWGHGSTAVVGYDVATRTQVGPDLLSSPAVAANVAAGTTAAGQTILAVATTGGGCFQNCGARLVDGNTGEDLATAAPGVTVNALAMSADTHVIATGGLDGTLQIWGWNTLPSPAQYTPGASAGPLTLLAPPIDLRSGISRISLTSDGRRLVTTTVDGTTRLWDVTGAGIIANGPDTSARDRVYALSPNASRIAAGGDELRTWNVARGAGDRTFTITAGTTRRLPAGFRPSLAFDPTGTRVLDGVTLDASGHPAVPKVLRGMALVGASSLSPYAFAVPESLLSGGGTGDPDDVRVAAIDIWNGRTIGFIRPALVTDALRRAHPGLAEVDLGLGGMVLPGEPAGGQMLFDAGIQSRMMVVDGQGRRAATFNQEGDLVVWDLRRGRPIAPPIIAANVQQGATAVAFSADGSEVAVGRVDGSIVRYALPSLRQVGTPFGGHAAAIGQVAFQPHGSLLAAASAEAVELLDLDSGTSVPLIAFNPPGSIGAATPPSGYAQFSADGRSLLTVGYLERRGALLWSLDPDDWVRAACRAAGRNLTQAEWRQLVGASEPYHRTCTQWPGAV